jgi:hypothetical protein
MQLISAPLSIMGFTLLLGGAYLFELAMLGPFTRHSVFHVRMPVLCVFAINIFISLLFLLIIVFAFSLGALANTLLASHPKLFLARDLSPTVW